MQHVLTMKGKRIKYKDQLRLASFLNFQKAVYYIKTIAIRDKKNWICIEQMKVITPRVLIINQSLLSYLASKSLFTNLTRKALNADIFRNVCLVANKSLMFK